MAVDLDRQVGARPHERPHERARRAGREDARHVLDGEGVDAHRDLLLRELHVGLHRVDGRGGVADRALRVAPVLLDAPDGLFEVARVVQRVEDAEDVHAVLARERHEAVHHVVRVVLVAEDVLTAQEHLERRLFADGLDLPEALPGVLAQEAHAHVERGAAPAFERVVAGAVDRLGDLENVVRPQPRGPQGLVGVAQRRVRDADLLLGLGVHVV